MRDLITRKQRLAKTPKTKTKLVKVTELGKFKKFVRIIK